MTDIIHALILGIVQGLTEFLPVSSSAHLNVFPWIFGWEEISESFDVALHLGTLLSICIFFFKDWINLIKGGFAEIMNSIYEAGIVDPQVCFLGIGDPVYDDAPLQVAQFETSDQTLDEWLESMWIEGGGGGNDSEGYILSWYFASRHTDCDAINKRNQKGILITIGDEYVTPKLTKHQIEDIFGDSVQRDIEHEDLYNEVSANWNVYHISMSYNNSMSNKLKQSWNFMGDNHIMINRDPNSAIESIVNIVRLNNTTTSVETPNVVDTKKESSEIL